MDYLFKKLDSFETHHKILVFLIIMISSIAATRFLVSIYNPNPIIFNLEIHHFDYGVLLLLISSKLMLFGNKKYNNLYLFLTAVASGLIIDEYIFIRKSVVENAEVQSELYNESLPYVIVSVVIVTLMVLFINSLKKK